MAITQAEIELVRKQAASRHVLKHSKSRAGRRPMSVGTLLKKEKDGTFFKGAAFGDTEPLWQDPNVGKVEFESKIPVKLNQRVTAPDKRPGDAPTDNMGGGVKSEDGRGNATTFSLGTNAGGDVVPDAMPSNYKLSAALAARSGSLLDDMALSGGTTDDLIDRIGKWRERREHSKNAKTAAIVDELNKLGAVSDEEAMDTLQRLDALDKNKFTPEQVGRYALLGAAAGPVVGLSRSLIQGKGFKGHFGDEHKTLLRRAQHVAGDAAAGAATSGAIPLVRSALDRQAAESKLREYMQSAPPHVQMPPPVGDDAAPMVDPSVKTAGLGSAHTEHLTDVLGLGAMAAGSGSHLLGQLRQKKDPNASEAGPINEAGQSAADLGGLATMAIPTIAALNQLRKGHVPGAGGGSRFVNVANVAGLGALAVPTADKLQAHVRAAPGEDPEKKMLLGEGAHRALELGGYGALAAGTLKNKDNDWKDKAMQLAGYGALAAPQVVPFEGAGRTALELGGLGALAVPSIRGMASHH